MLDRIIGGDELKSMVEPGRVGGPEGGPKPGPPCERNAMPGEAVAARGGGGGGGLVASSAPPYENSVSTHGDSSY